jgi:two-component system sensor histidine kinase KdpD
MPRWPLPQEGSWWGRIASALIPPILATLLSAAIHPDATGVPVALYLGAVVAASALGGARSGLAAATLSSVGFVFFFTDPRFTFRIDRTEQVLTAIVLVAVALGVGSVFARAVDERRRAEARERDARLMREAASLLIRAPTLEHGLASLVQALARDLPVHWCRLVAHLPHRTIQVDAGSQDPALHLERFPIDVADESVAEVVIGTTEDLDQRRGQLVSSAASLVGLALEREALDAAVRSARDATEVALLRAALFSSVTHDLRTPLAVIKAGVTSLRTDGEALPADAREALLANTADEVDRLDRLVGNILDLARARAGAIVLERVKTGVDELIDAVLTRLRPRLGSVHLRSLVRPDLPDVWVDPVQMDQVLTNVLDNALEHSPDRGRIDISAARIGDAIEIRIADEGPGVPTADRERLFEPFARGSGAAGRAGSGLGLAIARAVVTSHGGRIRLEAAPNGGAAVVITMPLYPEPAAT